MLLKLTPGEIVETVFINLDDLDVESWDGAYEVLTDFCIDPAGRVRLDLGIVAPFDDPDNPEFVPPERFEISSAPWNSHSQYFEIELPNPAVDFNQYTLIREAFFKELHRRMEDL